MNIKIRYLAAADKKDLAYAMRNIGVSEQGIAHMVKKGNCFCFQVDGLSNPAALIIKQKLLSLGGEVALAKEALLGGSGEKYGNSAIIMATELQLRNLAEYLQEQQFGLPDLADHLLTCIANISVIPADIGYDNNYFSGKLCFARPLIMGIVNMTPDSFFDGGQYNNVDEAKRRIQNLITDGADIVDIGGASSRPGHIPVPADEEMSRVLPIISEVSPKIHVPISIDTDKAVVAEAALKAGAAIINYTGMLDDDIAEVALKSDAPFMIMHQGGGADIMSHLHEFFSSVQTYAADHGLNSNKLIFDPGIGFGKNPQENITILNRLEELRIYGKPILLGMSNKRFLGAITGLPLEERSLAGSVAAALGYTAGAAIFRVHDVVSAKQALNVAEAIKKGVLVNG